LSWNLRCVGRCLCGRRLRWSLRCVGRGGWSSGRLGCFGLGLLGAGCDGQCERRAQEQRGAPDGRGWGKSGTTESHEHGMSL
jgi:hypothetical protein